MTLSRYWTGLAVVGALAIVSAASGMNVTLSSDFPGGNVRVIRNRGATIELTADLRGGKPWFYWQFDAKADQIGRVQFVLADSPQMGVQGPALSFDGGSNWQWLGAASVQFAGSTEPGKAAVKNDSFQFDFTNANRKVRFCVAMPYLQRDLDQFLAGQKANPNLLIDELTKSTKGRSVELLRIGKPGPGIQSVLVTARHHACESMASYVLEGFLKEALSDSPAGSAFRSRYVLYAVPIVDKDGVQAGDQGKGRSPHDHNRDYGLTNLYPEVRAIQALARDKKVELALDFHCPAIRGESHTTFYFDGLAMPPAFSNVVELSDWMAEEVPTVFSQGPFVWLKKKKASASGENLPFSLFFAVQKPVLMAATLEVPYALPGYPFTAAVARDYGASLLRAWARTGFVPAGQARTEGHSSYEAFQKTFQGLVRSKPEEAEQLANRYLDDERAPALYRIEARQQRGMLRFVQKRYSEALLDFGAVSTNAAATARQRAGALAQRVLIVCKDPTSDVVTVERNLADYLRLPYPAPAQKAQVHGAASAFYERTNRLDRALFHAREQLADAVPHEKGRTLNRIAALYDLMRQPEQALQCRRDAVALLRKQLNPVPVGVFGPLMGVELFDALNGIPTSSEKEILDAANIVLKHPLKFPEYVKRVSPPPPVVKK